MVNESSLDAEVLRVSSAALDSKREAYYDAVLHSGDDRFYITTLASVVITRDFANATSDYTEVNFSLSLGDVVKHIYPNRDHLEISLANYTLGKVVTNKYSFVVNKWDDMIENKKYVSMTQEELNQHMIAIKGQAIDKLAMVHRNKMVSGVYQDATVEDVMQDILTKNLENISSIFSFISDGIKLLTPNNLRVYKHIIIPKGIKLLDLPKYLQHSEYGVYNGDIMTYLKTYGDKPELIISPKHRPDTFGLKDKTLYVVAVPNMTVANIENTYVADETMVKVIAEKSNKLFNNDNRLKDTGTAIATTDSDTVMSRPYMIKPDSLSISSTFTDTKIAHRKNDDGFGMLNNSGVINNHYQARSNVLRNDGIVVQIKWKNSNARLIEPNMPIIYTFEDNNGDIVTYEGIVQRIDILTDNTKRIENSTITAFLRKPYSLDGTEEPDSFVSQIGEWLF